MQNIFQIETINKIGQRENLEDFITHKTLYDSSNLFLVCDGVGGLSKGEIASRFACESILAYFETHVGNLQTENDIQKSIKYAQDCFNIYVIEHPESDGMATTLALCYLKGSSAIVAHIGDSRVYHIRNGNILIKTIDHSLVNDLIKSGYITEEEAASHPKRNVITRAIQSSGKDVIADIEHIAEIKADDYFILCTDGILETIDDKFIEQNFVAKNNLNEVVQLINEKCDGKSSDNYSGIFIKMEKQSINF